MRFAYADPPYVGCANLYEEKQEVDQDALVRRLVVDFPDGWALSLHVPSLQQILAACPPDVRVLAWVKPFAAFRKKIRPQYAWEPVILRGGRPPEPKSFTCVRDWHAEHPPVFLGGKRKLKGVKSEAFCRWILDCLGFENDDEIVDIFPGSGILGDIVKQLRLA